MKRSGWKWKEVKLPDDLQAKLASDFERDFLEAAQAADPSNVDILISLADIYAKAGLHEEGLKIDQRLVEIQPKEPKFHYNLACAHSLLGHIDPALQALTRALQLGYTKVEHLRDDPDLENLKKDRRYEEILRQFAPGSTPRKKKIG